MSANAIAAAQSGISESAMIFYTIGGSSLICLAAIWVFSKILKLIENHRYGA